MYLQGDCVQPNVPASAAGPPVCDRVQINVSASAAGPHACDDVHGPASLPRHQMHCSKHVLLHVFKLSSANLAGGAAMCSGGDIVLHRAEAPSTHHPIALCGDTGYKQGRGTFRTSSSPFPASTSHTSLPAASAPTPNPSSTAGQVRRVTADVSGPVRAAPDAPCVCVCVHLPVCDCRSACLRACTCRGAVRMLLLVCVCACLCACMCNRKCASVHMSPE